MKPKQIAMIVLIVILGGFAFYFSGEILETNKSGFYQIKQASVTGDMTVKTTPGMYLQSFGIITNYQISDVYYFSKYDEDGGAGVEAQAIKVRFNDGGTAQVSGSIKFRLSLQNKDQLRLHEDFKLYDTVKKDLVRQVVTEALMQTATLMKAEESYSTRRSEFTSYAEEQVRRGIYETAAEEIKKKDAEGNEFIERLVTIKKDESGQLLIRKESPFKRYNIEILQFVIKDIDFDKTIDALISKKKEAEQMRVVAKANAEKAKQDAITAEEQGKAKIAIAKAEEDVKKIREVTQAEKLFEVSKFNRLQAEEDSKALLFRKEAEAKGNKLLVKAGLSPIEKATIEKEIAIGVAEKLSQIKLPQTMILGGGSGKGSGAMDPFTAIGLESFLNISKKMSKTKK